MSFASDVKKELTQLEVNDAEAKAELSALVRMNGVISLALGRGMTLDVSTENASIARRIYSLMKRLYDHPLDLFVRKKMRLKKNNVYIVRVSQHAETMLRDLEILGGRELSARLLTWRLPRRRINQPSENVLVPPRNL